MGNADSSLVLENHHVAFSNCRSEVKIIRISDGKIWPIGILHHPARGLVSVEGESYAVTKHEIVKIHKSLETSVLIKLDNEVAEFSQIVSFENKIYILQPEHNGMWYFNPADNTSSRTLPGCGLEEGFCACATEKYIYAMGGAVMRRSMKEFSSLHQIWTDITPLRNGRYHSSAVAINGNIYVLGGLEGSAFIKELKSAEFCNPLADRPSWENIPKMQFGRYSFSTCVADNKIYAVGGTGINPDSIEMFDGSQWKVVAILRRDFCSYSCIWHNSSPLSAISRKNSTSEVRPSDVQPSQTTMSTKPEPPTTSVKVTAKIGPDKQELNIPGCNIRIPEGAMGNVEDVMLSAHVDETQDKNGINITPKFKFSRPVTFRKPVWVRLKTSISAFAGKVIRALLLTRDKPSDDWTETDELEIRERNEVNFKISHMSEMKIVTKSSEGKLHLITDFYFHPQTSEITIVFTKDQPNHDQVEGWLLKRNFVNFALGPHDFVGDLGSLISVRLKCQHPPESEISPTVLPSPEFLIDEDYLIKGRHSIYFELEPEPSVTCKRIKILYECLVEGELNHSLPLKMEWPRKEDAKSCGNTVHNTYNTTASQVAFGGGRIHIEGSPNIAGPLTDQSITAGRINYGESNSTSHGETIQVTRN